jgi:hypothetical protein
MKKLILGLAAVFALSTSVPAFAGDDAGGEAKKEAKKPAKKGKKGAKKDEEKKAE